MFLCFEKTWGLATRHVIMQSMNPNESMLRSIKDRIARTIGEIEETAQDATAKENHARLSHSARELHRCADEMQNILMRIRPK